MSLITLSLVLNCVIAEEDVHGVRDPLAQRSGTRHDDATDKASSWQGFYIQN